MNFAFLLEYFALKIQQNEDLTLKRNIGQNRYFSTVFALV